MRFKFLTGDIDWETHGGKFVSRKLNNGEFDYWLVLEICNQLDDPDNFYHHNRYDVSLVAISPSKAGQANILKAARYCGFLDEVNEKTNPVILVELLSAYGIVAPCWQKDGNNITQLMREARKQADCVVGLFGFYMDAPKNRIGSTGWDCLKGDLMAGLDRGAQ